MDLDIVANADAIAHEHILTKRTTLTNHGTGTDMHPMPDTTTSTYPGTIVHNGGKVHRGRGVNPAH